MIYPTEEEYIRSLRLELKWITPSYVLAIAGTFFMTLGMIFLFLRGKQLHRCPGCCRGCSPGWSFCCIIPIIVILALFIAEMVILSSPTGLYLMYLEIIITSTLRNPALGLFFVLVMIYALATMIGVIIFVVFAIQYADGRKRHEVKNVIKLSKDINRKSQRTFQMGNTTVVHDGNKEWAVIDLGHPDDESTLGTTSSSPGSDDELQESTETGDSVRSEEQSQDPNRYDGLY
jgi:hypothetical protein